MAQEERVFPSSRRHPGQGFFVRWWQMHSPQSRPHGATSAGIRVLGEIGGASVCDMRGILAQVVPLGRNRP